MTFPTETTRAAIPHVAFLAAIVTSRFLALAIDFLWTRALFGEMTLLLAIVTHQLVQCAFELQGFLVTHADFGNRSNVDINNTFLCLEKGAQHLKFTNRIHGIFYDLDVRFGFRGRSFLGHFNIALRFRFGVINRWYIADDD